MKRQLRPMLEQALQMLLVHGQKHSLRGSRESGQPQMQLQDEKGDDAVEMEQYGSPSRIHPSLTEQNPPHTASRGLPELSFDQLAIHKR